MKIWGSEIILSPLVPPGQVVAKARGGKTLVWTAKTGWSPRAPQLGDQLLVGAELFDEMSRDPA